MTVPQTAPFTGRWHAQSACQRGKIHQNRRAGTETRPYKRGAESSPPTIALYFYFSIGTVKTVPYARNTLYRVGRGLAPAVNSHRTLRRGQAPALPWKLYFVRVGNGLDRSIKLYQITRADTVRPYEYGTTEDVFRKIITKFAGDS